MSAMERLSEAIAQTDSSIAIASAAWVIPTVQSIHIVAIAAVMSATAMLNLRLAGFIGQDASVRSLARRSLPWLWWSLPVLLATGIVMILGEPARELTNAYFWSKMAMVALVIVLTITLQRLLDDRPYREMAPARRRAVRSLSLLTLALWLAIIFCGRWIAYS
ncbi:MAG TPA: DUF6644 family protein [Steroidobacteraceae bacterium]|nr:DUF6644 family protein [Steroidobacteraceae bacterium]